MVERVKVTLPPLGSPKIEAEGFVGTDCRTATEGLERMLASGGGKTVVEKPEMMETAHDQHEQEHQHY